MLTDAGAIALALLAARLARRPAGGGFTFGMRRAEILSAQVNGATLVALAVLFLYAGIQRLDRAARRGGRDVLVVAVVGIGVNLAATAVLAGADRRSLNVEGAFQHVLTDLFAFIATAVAGVVILVTGFTQADGIAALMVAALMLRSGCGAALESGRVLLEASPRDLDPQEIGRALASEPARGGGARPACLGGELGLPRAVRSYHGRALRLRHADPPPRPGGDAGAERSASSTPRSRWRSDTAGRSPSRRWRPRAAVEGTPRLGSPEADGGRVPRPRHDGLGRGAHLLQRALDVPRAARAALDRGHRGPIRPPRRSWTTWRQWGPAPRTTSSTVG